MATRRIRLKDVKRVDLEIDAWLLEWAMNPDWDIEDFGAYWLVCLILYSDGGEMEFDMKKIAKMCRSNPTRFAKTWKRIESKLPLCGTKVMSKRVRKELKAAQRRMQASVNAGVKGAEKRWGRHSIANTKRNETNTKTKTTSNTKERALSLSSSVRFADALEKILMPRTKSDRTSLLNLTQWLMLQIKEGRFDEDGVYAQVLEIAKGSKKEGRVPIALFYSMLDREIGYRAKAAAQLS